MKAITKATFNEKRSYHGLHPLYGWIIIDGHRCAIEDLRGAGPKDDPAYEVLAPAGMKFDGDLHQMVAFDLRDARQRCIGVSTHPCDADCDHDPEHQFAQERGQK